MAYSHTHFGVVEQIFHPVCAGEIVPDLGPVGDHARNAVYRSNSAKDGDVLDIWEVWKLSTPNMTAYLLMKKYVLAWQLSINLLKN